MAVLYRLPVVGQRVGGYLIKKKLGRGGFGTVFLAERAGRQYALKFVRSLDFEPWAEREVEVLHRLRHPHIVRFIGCDYWPDEEWGLRYVVMEYVEGETLEARMGRAPCYSARQVLEWALPVAEALAEAHRWQVVHRDVKPSNILLRAGSGEPVLVDFGAGHLVGAPEATFAGMPPGTREYRSPEVWRSLRHMGGAGPYQARGSDDHWALAVVVYQLLTGQLPFEGEPRRVLEEPLPPPHQLNPRVPEAFSRLCLRELEKSLGDRLPDDAALCEALRQLRAHADASWEVPLFDVPPAGARTQAVGSAPATDLTPTEEGLKPPGARDTPPPAGAEHALWTTWRVLALGAALLVVLLLASRAAHPPSPTVASSPPALQPATCSEVAPRSESLESVAGAVPTWASTPAPVATATQTQETPVKARRKSHTFTAQARNVREAPRSVQAGLCMLATGALVACSSLPQPPAQPPLPPEECPQGAIEFMEQMDTPPPGGSFLGAYPGRDGMGLIPTKEGEVMVEVLDTAKFRWTRFPERTFLSGKQVIRNGRIYARLTQAILPGGVRKPVCIEISSKVDGKRGSLIQGTVNAPGTVIVFSSVNLVPVERFE